MFILLLAAVVFFAAAALVCFCMVRPTEYDRMVDDAEQLRWLSSKTKRENQL